MTLLAHITTANNQRLNQSLAQHCRSTAAYAGESLRSIGMYNTAYLAGLLHDMGKATAAFNDYLLKAYNGEKVLKGSVNHTFTGVIYILETFHKKDIKTVHEQYDNLVSEIIAYAVGAHHGLFDCLDIDGNNGFDHRLTKDRDEIRYYEAVTSFLANVASQSEISAYFVKASQEIEHFFSLIRANASNKDEPHFYTAMMTRMLTAAVINADRKDTAEFMTQIPFSEMSLNWQDELTFYNNKISLFDNSGSLNKVRSVISQQCEKAAARSSDIYSLNVPTGGGKTLSALRYALNHANIHNKKRIIFIIPLLSILDQNSDVIKNYIAHPEMILEHHSNVISDDVNTSDSTKSSFAYENLKETWDSPIIISTMVQLLNILFTDKTSALRRLQSLCNSIVIIDEIQFLPRKSIALFSLAVNFLKYFCGCTIILSSATQPALNKIQYPISYARDKELVTLSEEQLGLFKRSNIYNCLRTHGYDYDELVSFIASNIEERSSLLIICNTKKQARELYIYLSDRMVQYDVLHLSTSMCKRHRKNTLNLINESLKTIQKSENQKGLICVATQLVEAGIDFSFKSVIRVLAGFENLVQAAGRCNRSNEYGTAGNVFLVNLKGENLSMLPEIKDSQDALKNALAINRTDSEIEITDSMINLYYGILFNNIKESLLYKIDYSGVNTNLTHLLSNNFAYHTNPSPYRLKQPFKFIGQTYKIFDDNTIDVIVPYGEGAEIISALSNAGDLGYKSYIFSDTIKSAADYCVEIYRWQYQKLFDQGLLHQCMDDLVCYLDPEAYDARLGLNEDTKRNTTDFIL